MRASRLSALRRLGWHVLLSLLAISTAHAQTVTLATPVAAIDDLASVLEQGARLERERRWAEALSHYEDAFRQHPNRPDLQQRVALARAHYDVCRRYGDPSYVSSLRTINERDAAAIYDDVLLKIQSHYVNEPQWQRVLNCGLTNVEVAVTEPQFVEKQLATMPVERLTSMQRDARELVSRRS